MLLPPDPPGFCGTCGVQLVRPPIHSFWPGDSPQIDGEIFTEAKWGANDFVRDNNHWHCQDGDSTEIEVSLLVGAFVRAQQPTLVVETGTAWGQTTRFIGEALKENGHGHLVGLEIDDQRLAYSNWYCHELVCEGWVSIVNTSSVEYTPTGEQRVDMLFSDSDCDLRVPELQHYAEFMDTDGLIMFHDTAPGHCRSLQEKIEAEMGDKYRCIRLHTPRGLTIVEVLK